MTRGHPSHRISPATLRRLRNIKQGPVVWEGVRCQMSLPLRRASFSKVIPLIPPAKGEPEIILWADATNGMVRSMTPVEPGTGNEAMVRALIQAIENPQSNTPPLRPQKVIVKDRQIQFYLRGILQDLDITVDFAESLPFVDDIIQTISEHTDHTPTLLPYDLAPQFYHQVEALWHLAPWKYMYDHYIIEAKVNRWDVNSFFITFMKDVGVCEAGVLFYHSLDSIRQFRLAVMESMFEDLDSMEDTFLSQDCIFIMFNSGEDMPDSFKQMLHNLGWKIRTHYPYFSVLHPLEGEREFLQEEEVLALTATIQALNVFFTQHAKAFRGIRFPKLKMVHTPTAVPDPSPIEIVTLLEESLDILSLIGDYGEEEEEVRTNTHIIPRDSVITRGYADQSTLEQFRECAVSKLFNAKKKRKTRQPILIIQNSKSGIMEMIEAVRAEGGLRRFGFATKSSSDPMEMEVGVLVTERDNMYLFSMVFPEEKDKIQFSEWKQECEKQRECVVLLAMGFRGKTRGNPKPNHIFGYYELDYLTERELNFEIEIHTMGMPPIFI